MKFYTDVHIDKAVALQARKRGIDVLRCQDVEMDNAQDIEHLVYATNNQRVMITADEDFTILHNEWLRLGRQHAGIIYVQLSHKDDIGMLVEFIEYVHLAVAEGAADANKDVYNQLIFL